MGAFFEVFNLTTLGWTNDVYWSTRVSLPLSCYGQRIAVRANCKWFSPKATLIIIDWFHTWSFLSSVPELLYFSASGCKVKLIRKHFAQRSRVYSDAKAPTSCLANPQSMHSGLLTSFGTARKKHVLWRGRRGPRVTLRPSWIPWTIL